ncbi:hypothetical protein C8J57DRAFT_1279248 [Mycena rebaudengoi]|nr:hypothetical protein C8J57DRAFT_1279248 [Mycena rebaudengoi]
MFSPFTASGLVLALLSSLAAVSALCLPCQVRQATFTLKTPPPSLPRGVYSPAIIAPDASTKWMRSTKVAVTWSTSDIPKDITNPKGTILIGRLKDGSSNEHLDLKHPLANGIDIRAGNYTITVPDVAAGSDYIIVLMGDSGNRSQKFSIQ